jgi:glycosyltransferase involved in cell wall biosynthesis
VEWTPWDAEDELAQLLRFDIGLMPLTEDEWARGKSANKAIYYMALGIPAVVSPVGVNSEVVLDGQTGFHARTTEEWVTRLTQLIVDPGLRAALGQHGRQHMLAHYSKGVAARKLSALLHDTIARREQGQGARAIPRVADAQPG